MGLQGMINDLVAQSDFSLIPMLPNKDEVSKLLHKKDVNTIARLISLAEGDEGKFKIFFDGSQSGITTPVLGITGTGGAGKSSLVDELVRRFLMDFPDKTVGIISVDPSKRKTGGALLGDRIRMNSINNPRVYMRSLATRQSNLALSKHVNEAVTVLKAAKYDLIILETSGIGQSDTEIIEHSNVSLYVMTPEFGAATQLEKIDMLDFADLVAINKFDKRGALDALRDVKKQYMRNNNLWEVPQDQLPVFGTIASQFNDPGMNTLYKAVIDKLAEKTESGLKPSFTISNEMSEKVFVIPPSRTRYLSEIAENNRTYDKKANKQVEIAQKLYGFFKTIETITGSMPKLDKFGIDFDSIDTGSQEKKDLVNLLVSEFNQLKINLNPFHWEIIMGWDEKISTYKNPVYTFKVRDKEIKIETHTESLSHTQIPKVALPKYQAWGDILRWCLQENVPGEFPYTSGLYPFKRTGEDPARMFAGEGGPERTNKRFHYVSAGLPAKRLSTAFHSVTLYGTDPDYRPDI
jgi:methylmalonyl-CoA mutase